MNTILSARYLNCRIRLAEVMQNVPARPFYNCKDEEYALLLIYMKFTHHSRGMFSENLCRDLHPLYGLAFRSKPLDVNRHFRCVS